MTIPASERRFAGEEPFLSLPVHTLVRRRPVAIAADKTIREAAERMTHDRVSAILVVGEAGLEGIVTDRDLRSRVIAGGRSYEEPVAAVMTKNPVVVASDARAVEALLAMTERNIHHLPVMQGGKLAGMITATDFVNLQADSPIYLLGDIRRQETAAGVAEVSLRRGDLLCRLVAAGASADAICRVVTAIGDAVARRLLALGEASLGTPPASYGWVLFGSQARREQTLRSDQDHGLILAAGASAEDQTYFSQLARFVSDGLASCGYPYCPGNAMATNPDWRQPIDRWRAYFRAWIHTPEPLALLHASMFFDMRPVWGEAALCASLRAEVLGEAKDQPLFAAHLAKNAIQHRPPLGLFRRFVLARGGAPAKTLDLKHGGVVPLVDLARVFALEIGADALATRDRLRLAAEARRISPEDARSLIDVFEFIDTIRLRHQARQVSARAPADNYVAPAELSSFERRHLRQAFSLVRTSQDVLEHSHQLAHLGG